MRELIAEFDPELVRPRDRLRALGGDRWEIKAVIDGECRRSLEQLLHWLSHVNPAMDYGELLQRVVADAVAKYDPARRPAGRARPAAAAPKAKAGEGAPVSERRGRDAAGGAAKAGAGSRGGERRSRDAAVGTAAVGGGLPLDERRSRGAATGTVTVGGGLPFGARQSLGAAVGPAEVDSGTGAQDSERRTRAAEMVALAPAVVPRSRREHRDGADTQQAGKHLTSRPVQSGGAGADQPGRHRTSRRTTDRRAAANCDPARGAAPGSYRGAPGGAQPEHTRAARGDRIRCTPDGCRTTAREAQPSGWRRARNGSLRRIATAELQPGTAAPASTRDNAGSRGCRQFGATANTSSAAEAPSNTASSGSSLDHLARTTTVVAKRVPVDAPTSAQKRAGRMRCATGCGGDALAQERGIRARSVVGCRNATTAGQPEPPARERPDLVGRRRARATVTRAIPAAVRRHIWLRDGGRCTYRDPDTGRCCGARHLLQIDHIQPFAIGGGTEENNLRLLCAAHNRARSARRAARSP